MIRKDIFQYALKHCLLLLFYTFFSIGLFYDGSKFHVPWYCAKDFVNYAKMIDHPLGHSVGAPFGYRIITPTLSHYVQKCGFFYEAPHSPFKDAFLVYQGINYHSSALSAIIFVNFCFIILALFFLLKTIQIILPAQNLKDKILQLGLPSLLLLSFSTIVHGFSGLTEGGTLFFICLLSYFFYRNQRLLFTLTVFISILQRELIPLVIFLYIASLSKVQPLLKESPNQQIFNSLSIFNTKSSCDTSSLVKKRIGYLKIISILKIKIDYIPYLICCILGFIGYFVIRYIFPLPGFEEQSNLYSFIFNTLHFKLTKEIFFQCILASNIIFLLFIGLCLFGFRYTHYFIPYLFVVFTLTLLGIGTGIGNNIGRILNMATPLFILCTANCLQVSRYHCDKNVLK